MNDFAENENEPIQARPVTIPPPADDPTPLSYRMVGDMGPLFAALAEATLGFEPIQKDRHVKIQTKDRSSYEFDYATLEEVLRRTTPALAKNGLKLWHFLCDAPDGAREIHHMLTHASGAYLETVQVIRLRDTDGWQQFGSAVTYARRYQVQCQLGVSAEFDDDGNHADGNEVKEARDRSKAPTPKPQNKPQAPAQTAPPKEPPKDNGSGEEAKCSDDLLRSIGLKMAELKMNRTEALARAHSVIGDKPKEQWTMTEGKRLLASLEAEQDATQ